MESSVPIVAITVGNTRTRWGLFRGKELSSAQSMNSDDTAGITAAIQTLTTDLHGVPIVMSSVNEPAARAISSALEQSDAGRVLRIGEDVLVPMQHALDDASTLGQDRILCAFAAFRRAKQACVVIDAGTAITVDFVDGEGTFLGGAIAPGLNMMLASMHEHTAALPKLEYQAPDDGKGAFGLDTRHAMILGVRAAATGLVHYLIDAYATAYEAYPQIIATGGDAATLFEKDDLVEHIVPDLQLIGILEACVANDEEAADDQD